MRIVPVVACCLVLIMGGCWRTGPTTPQRPPVSTPPQPMRRPDGPRDPLVDVASSDRHNCAVHRSGTLECWGRNVYGQLGAGTRRATPGVVSVAGIRDAAAVAVGSDFSCVLRRNRTVACWGNNEDGQLGNGRGRRPGAKSLVPVPVTGLSAVAEVSAGEYHACARDTRGRVRCWGNAGNGQIGSDAQRAFDVPRAIDRLRPVAEIASGANHVCARERSGGVWCWGRNTEGQLGDGKSGSRIKPVAVAGLEDAVQLASGANHTCAVRRSGMVVCWGDNSGGQLGMSAVGQPKRNTPVTLRGLSAVAQLAGGAGHSCARLDSGRVYCWGANASGQLGHRATPRQRAEPTVVRGIDDAADLALGLSHTCALRRLGEVVCWGARDDGVLGRRPLI